MLILDQLQKSDRHLRLLSWVVAAGLLVLLTGLWWVQVVRSRAYVENQRNQSYRTVRVPAPRGKILDRTGNPLADNQPSYSISIYLGDRSWREAVQREYKRSDEAARKSGSTPRKPKLIERALALFGYKPASTQPRKLTPEEKTMLGNSVRFSVTSNIVWQLGMALRQPLVLTNEAKFRQHYNRRRALPFPIRVNLTPEEIARFQEQSIHLPGVDMEMQPMRIYPQGALGAHIVGCLTHLPFEDMTPESDFASFNYHLPDYRGYDGIEASLNPELAGKAGAKSVLVNNLGYRQSETVLSPIEAGKNITLTIDADIQRETEKALREESKGAELPVRGAAVVLDARSGEIIAMASSPTFNPNHWIPRLSHDVWNTYTNEDEAPLQNRAIFGSYMPGSTFKIIVGLAGLESGTLDPAEIVQVEANPVDRAHGICYVGPGRRPFKDTAPPGDYSFHRAFIKSSNGYFIEQGLRVTPQRIVALAQQFHLGRKTDIPLRESRGLVPTTQWMRENHRAWSPVATANFSIGQGDLNVTPLQLARAVAALVNGGKILRPSLVQRITGPDELIPDQTVVRPEIRDEIHLNEEHLKLVREAMLADVENSEGTAYKGFADFRKTAASKVLRIGGKTGTAQVEKTPGKIDHHTVWFASFGQSATRDYAVVVMVDYGNSGGGTCAPVAAKIYERLEYRERHAPPQSKNALARN